MPPREGLVVPALLGAALFLVVPWPGSAIADPTCPVSGVDDAVVEAVTAAGTLLTTEGREIVLAGLAFPSAAAAANESAGESGHGAAFSRLATGPVRIATAGSPDRYGRIRANVYLGGGRWLQAELVSAGLAVARPEGGDAACLRSLLALESAARRAGAGLWAGSGIVVNASDETSLLAENGLYALVEGRVVSVGYGSRMVFLDFGRSFRTDFTVMVPKTLVPRLLEAGIAVESLAGRAVRVRGVIEESGGPAIRLTDPLALELLDLEE